MATYSEGTAFTAKVKQPRNIADALDTLQTLHAAAGVDVNSNAYRFGIDTLCDATPVEVLFNRL